ncbi:MAG: thymidylate synthase, partial [Megasphaera elsdenii]|nr:thymidylate synthase [Megasphaera elsdenii]
DLEKEFPILTTKKVAFKTAVKEILWIYQKQSNDVNELHKQNVHIWDEWMQEDGTIGTAYGYVIRKYHQMDQLLKDLKTDPQSRRMMVNLWQIPYLDTGSLYPCCFLSMWDVTDGHLNCMLVQRSGDMGLGVPFNTTQYAVLTHLIAQSVGLKPGLLTHVINNAHVYENHVQAMKTQLARRDQAFPAPKLVLDPDVHDFYDFTIDDIALDNYQHLGKLPMEVAV